MSLNCGGPVVWAGRHTVVNGTRSQLVKTVSAKLAGEDRYVQYGDPFCPWSRKLVSFLNC
jgi:hypothetical protein